MVYLPNDNTMKNELSKTDFWVECDTCKAHIKNWSGSTSCCGSTSSLIEGNEESAEPQKKTAGERKIADMSKQLSDNIKSVKIERRYTYNGRFAPLGHAWYLVQQIIKVKRKGGFENRAARYEIAVPVELAYIAEHGEEQVIEELKELYKEAFEKPIK